MLNKIVSVFIFCFFLLCASSKAVEINARKADSVMAALEKNPDDTNKVNSLIQLAFANMYMGTPDASLKYAWKALALEKTFGHKKRIALIYRKIGNIYFDGINNYEKALEYYLQSLKLYQEINDKTGIAACYNNMGNIYSQKSALAKDENDYNTALQYHFNALKLYKELSEKNLIMNSYMNIADAYLVHSDYAKAIEYYKNCNQLNMSMGKGDTNAITLTYTGMAEAYTGMGDYQKALESIDHLNKFIDTLSNQKNVIIVNSLFADTYLKLKNYKRSFEYLQKLQIIFAGKLDPRQDVTPYRQNMYFMLSRLYFETKEFEKAYSYYAKYVGLKDSVQNAKISRDMQLMPILNESEMKERELEQQHSLLNKRNIQIIALIAILLLIVVSSILFYNRYTNKQKEKFNAEILNEKELSYRKALEAEEKERSRIAKDLHDGIGQVLSSIKLNVHALKQKLSDDKQEETPLLGNISDLIDESIKDVRALSHNLAPSALEKAKLDEVLIRFVDTINAGGKLFIHLQIINLPEGLNNSFVATLYRVIQEAVNNMIKYAQATEATIQLVVHEEELTLLIEDNGVGFDPSKINQWNGMGLKNMSSRIDHWKGKINIDSQPGKGTTIIIEVPIVKKQESI